MQYPVGTKMGDNAFRELSYTELKATDYYYISLMI